MFITIVGKNTKNVVCDYCEEKNEWLRTFSSSSHTTNIMVALPPSQFLHLHLCGTSLQATANDILVNYHSLKSFIFSSLCEQMFSFLNLSTSNHPAPPPIEIIPQVCDLQWSAFYSSEIRNSDQVHPLILCFLLLDLAF